MIVIEVDGLVLGWISGRPSLRAFRRVTTARLARPFVGMNHGDRTGEG